MWGALARRHPRTPKATNVNICTTGLTGPTGRNGKRENPKSYLIFTQKRLSD